jgi:hypothetical protein
MVIAHINRVSQWGCKQPNKCRAAEEKWFIGCANLPRVWATTNPIIVHILMANGQLRCHQGYMVVAKPHPILALRSSLWGQDPMAQRDPLTLMHIASNPTGRFIYLFFLQLLYQFLGIQCWTCEVYGICKFVSHIASIGWANYWAPLRWIQDFGFSIF